MNILSQKGPFGFSQTDNSLDESILLNYAIDKDNCCDYKYTFTRGNFDQERLFCEEEASCMHSHTKFMSFNNMITVSHFNLSPS